MAVAVVINLLFFPSGDRPHHHQAIARASTDDIIELGLRLTNVEATHDAFGRLAQIGPDADVYVTSDVFLRPGSSFLEKLIGLGRADSVRLAGTNHDLAIRPEAWANFIVAQGELWRLPGHQRAGRPSLTWAIAAQSGTPEEWLFASQLRDPNWLFIDARLISDDVWARIVT